jgi:zinc-binding in reverse transcriptase
MASPHATLWGAWRILESRCLYIPRVSAKHGEWQLYLIEQLNIQARTENDLLHQSLSAIQLSQSRDIPQWYRNSSATFTTKPAYRFITDMPYMEEDLFKLSKIKIPLKVHVFLWLMLRNILLTVDNMIKRGWVITTRNNSPYFSWMLIC